MSIIKVWNLAYARVQVPDLRLAAQFFSDFGLIEAERGPGGLYFRGLGPEQQLLIVQQGERRLLANGFEVSTREDLDRAAAQFGGEVVERDEPGGGWQVCVNDPDGTRVELVWGMAKREPLSLSRQPMNDASDRLRRKGDLCRPPAGPSHVLRYGHVVMTTPQPDALAAWYRDVFGFLLSDEVVTEDGDILLSFNRLDRGEEFVDHHMFQTVLGPAGGLHHISFEVLDLDDLQCGSVYLADKGYRRMWGVGRHKQGSQIFDYWIDPFGVMYEHWTDSDMLNAATPPTRETIEHSLGPWGPPLPEEFIKQSA